MNCSVAQTLEVVGEWWSLLIIRDVFLGVTRFDDLQARLGISRNVLTQRLEHLIDHDVLERVPYQTNPVRCDYRLTEQGRDLWPVLTAMREWGDRWSAPHGAPIEVVHTACGHRARSVLTCSECGEPLEPRDVRAVAGPGIPEDALLPPRVEPGPTAERSGRRGDCRSGHHHSDRGGEPTPTVGRRRLRSCCPPRRGADATPDVDGRADVLRCCRRWRARPAAATIDRTQAPRMSPPSTGPFA